MQLNFLKNSNWHFIILVLILPLSACQQNNGKDIAKIATTEDNHDHSESDIQLNKGEKWKVDDHMMVHLRNMEGAVVALENPSLSECKTLSTQLQNHLNLLTSNCTMQGEAHDELHKWLLPFLELVNSFQMLSQRKMPLLNSVKSKNHL